MSELPRWFRFMMAGVMLAVAVVSLWRVLA